MTSKGPSGIALAIALTLPVVASAEDLTDRVGTLELTAYGAKSRPT